MLLVGTTNAAPTMFWGVTYVYSGPSLLSELRDEINDLTCEVLFSAGGSKGVNKRHRQVRVVRFAGGAGST